MDKTMQTKDLTNIWVTCPYCTESFHDDWTGMPVYEGVKVPCECPECEREFTLSLTMDCTYHITMIGGT